MNPKNTANSRFAKNANLKTDFQNHYITNPPMTEQFIAPPARVWEKIERVLDEQDRMRSTRVLYSQPSNLFSKTKNRLTIYLAAAGATIIAGFFVWK